MSCYLIACAFVALDYITGLCKAWATEAFSSKIMRVGLWHKLALVFAMVVGWLADYAQGLVDIGIAAPVGGAVCVYIIMMELVSSLENLSVMNPDLLPERLMALFGCLKQPPAELAAKTEEKGVSLKPPEQSGGGAHA